MLQNWLCHAGNLHTIFFYVITCGNFACAVRLPITIPPGKAFVLYIIFIRNVKAFYCRICNMQPLCAALYQKRVHKPKQYNTAQITTGQGAISMMGIQHRLQSLGDFSIHADDLRIVQDMMELIRYL